MYTTIENLQLTQTMYREQRSLYEKAKTEFFEMKAIFDPIKKAFDRAYEIAAEAGEVGADLKSAVIVAETKVSEIEADKSSNIKELRAASVKAAVAFRIAKAAETYYEESVNNFINMLPEYKKAKALYCSKQTRYEDLAYEYENIQTEYRKTLSLMMTE